LNKTELADRLRHLDPGAVLSLEEEVHAEAFAAASLSDEVVGRIEAFALENRCTFVCDEHGRRPTFVKDDVY
jgi:hypothetical protein